MFFQAKCIGVDLKVFLAEKMGKGSVFQEIDVHFLHSNDRNSFRLKYIQLSISQSRSSSQTTYISN